MNEKKIAFNFQGKDYELSESLVAELIVKKIERTATIAKNVRERADGSIKDLVSLAIDNKVLELSQALAILTEKDKETNRANKELLIAELRERKILGEPTKDSPTADDYSQALAKVLKGEGQNDF